MTEHSLEIGGDLSDRVRSPREVAKRTLVLFSLMARAFGAPKTEIRTWLEECRLFEELTLCEKKYLDNPSPTRRDNINVAWKSEALLVLVWALKLINNLPPSEIQCDTSLFKELLPPFSDLSEEEFIEQAQLRDEKTLFEMARCLQTEHAKARCERNSTHSEILQERLEILQERHYAINWIIGYCNQEWDEITTDT